MDPVNCDALIIGGGFYGLYLADYAAARLRRVLLCERLPDLMQRASFGNQARVHNGYHYPRSMLTARRSRVSFPRFASEFRLAIDSTIETIYAVARHFSKVSAAQFFESSRRIGAPIRPAPDAVARLFDPAYVAAAFLTEEYVFDSSVLKQMMRERVERAGVEVRTRTTVRSVAALKDGGVHVEVEGPDGNQEWVAGHVFCCGYAHLNAPGVASGLSQVPLKHELVEIALVEPPEEFRRRSATVMDGPFFTLMPFPARAAHALYHVRYSPHAHWYDGKGTYRPAYETLESAPKRTAFPHMARDAARYVPAMAQVTLRESLWEVRTVLPLSEVDDSRPILFKPHFGIPNYHLVMGGKIDNVYDIIDVIGQTLPDLSP